MGFSARLPLVVELVSKLNKQVVIMDFKVVDVFVVEVVLPIAMNPFSVVALDIFFPFLAASSKAFKA